MPEGPEVACVTEFLNRYLSGTRLTGLGWPDHSRFAKKQMTYYTEFCQSLPLTISYVTCHGKNIIFVLTNGHQTMYMTNHLKMEGNWSYQPEKDSYVQAYLNYECPIKSQESDGIEYKPYTIYFSDSRKFGTINFYFNDKHLQDDFLSKLGPDLLRAAQTNTDLSPQWHKSITTGTRKNMILYTFLKEQKYFSGIGNYLAAEIMYESRISPFRKLGELTPEEISLLYQTVIRIILAAHTSRGLTISTYKDPNGYKGTYKIKIYKQDADPDGNPVQHDKKCKGGQTIHWVPAVQK